MATPIETLYAAAFQAMRSDDLVRAESVFNQIVAIDAKSHLAWNLLGIISIRLGMPDVGVTRANKAVNLDKRNAGYLNTLAVALGEIGELEQAQKNLQKAIKFKPGFAEAYYNLGKVYLKLGNASQAIDSYRRAYAIDPGYAGLRFNYAYVCRLSGDVALARRLLSELRQVDPLDADAATMMLEIDSQGLDSGKQLEIFASEIARFPHLAAVRERYATLCLTAGHLEQGWGSYWFRLCLPMSVRQDRLDKPDSLPLFPPNFNGQVVLVRAEQGIGDMLFFLRFLDDLKQRGCKILLEVQPKLLPVFSGLGVADELIGQKNFQVASVSGGVLAWAGDLPLLLQNFSYVAPLTLRPDPLLVAEWRHKLAAYGPGPYLGLTWRAGTDGSRTAEFDALGSPLRSLSKHIPVEALGRAVRAWPGTFLSLQRLAYADDLKKLGEALPRTIIDLSAINDDLQSMLALLACLDDYVCVSNTNVHLRAGMGMTGRVLVPEPEYRWGAEGDESPWFPGWKVYRKANEAGWDKALAKLQSDLKP